MTVLPVDLMMKISNLQKIIFLLINNLKTKQFDMKKITYFLMTAIAIFFIGCADEKINLEEQENANVQKLVFEAEFPSEPETVSILPNGSETRIYYVDRPAGSATPGLDARWQVGDKIEFFLHNTNNQKQAVVGRVIGMNNTPGKENVARVETVVSDFNLNIPLTYYGVTGSGVSGTYSIPWGSSIWRLTEPKYFQGGGSWSSPGADYHLIKTNHLTNDWVVNAVNSTSSNSAYQQYLRPAVIQVTSGNGSNGTYIYMRFRNIGSFFNVEITNTTNQILRIKEMTVESQGGTQWVYPYNNTTNRYDPTPGVRAMTSGSSKVSSYTIFNYTQNNDNRFFNIPANNGKNNHYQWFIPADVSVGDLRIKVVLKNNSTKYITIPGTRTYTKEKRYNIKRTWNGTDFS